MKKITKDKLEPNMVYAVQYVDDKSYKHRGLIMVSAKGKVWRSWNVAECDQWMEKDINLTSKYHIYPCTEMERQFAYTALDAQSQRAHNQALLHINNRQKRELKYYRTNKLHGMAEKVNKAFNGGGYRDEEE